MTMTEWMQNMSLVAIGVLVGRVLYNLATGLLTRWTR